MITQDTTLEDVCFAVAATLESHGLPGVLTGGSAAAVYAPESYHSHDADFILLADDSLDLVSAALGDLGFERIGKSRLFSHPRTELTIDFPKGPLAVGGDYVQETHVLERGKFRLRILTRTDCVRDRLAHYYHWDDYTALNAAVAVAAKEPGETNLDILRSWTERESPQLLDKLMEFERRLSVRLAEKTQ